MCPRVSCRSLAKRSRSFSTASRATSALAASSRATSRPMCRRLCTAPACAAMTSGTHQTWASGAPETSRAVTSTAAVAAVAAAKAPVGRVAAKALTAYTNDVYAHGGPNSGSSASPDPASPATAHGFDVVARELSIRHMIATQQAANTVTPPSAANTARGPGPVP